MQNLINLLTEKTQDLKEQFLIKIENYAKIRFEKVITKLANQPYVEWLELYSVDYTQNIKTRQPEIIHKRSEYLNKNYYKMRNKIFEVQEQFSRGIDVYVAKELKKAENHYTNSIIKLAARIVKKGITLDNDIQITYSRVDVNITITIVAKDITVRAFTIIASGPVQKEHYRFLVK